MRALIFLLFTALALAQPPGAPKPIFADNTQDPTKAGGAELLEAVCPGHVVVGKEIECKIACPEGTDFHGDDQGWELRRIVTGHFLSPTSDDAVLSVGGCESHSFNFGGTILLSRQSGKWTMLWYKGGVPTETCHKAKLQNRREILVCLGDYGGQGFVATDLFLEDLLSPTRNLMAGEAGTFFNIFDTTARCGDNIMDDSKPLPLVRGYIERIEFHNRTDGSIRGLSVFARRGERSITLEQVEACFAEQNPTKPHKGLDFRPPTKSYRVDFTFDGHTFKRTR